MKVWIIEKDHQPITTLRDTPEGAAAARAILNSLPTNEDHYYDAVLYERIEPGCEQMTDEEKVKAKYPDAELYGYHHGKVRVQSPTAGILGDMAYLGTREKRRAYAWESAAANLDEV